MRAFRIRKLLKSVDPGLFANGFPIGLNWVGFARPIWNRLRVSEREQREGKTWQGSSTLSATLTRAPLTF